MSDRDQAMDRWLTKRAVAEATERQLAAERAFVEGLQAEITRLRSELATARKDERERCAKVCEMPFPPGSLLMTNPDESVCDAAVRIRASAIRALGEE